MRSFFISFLRLFDEVLKSPRSITIVRYDMKTVNKTGFKESTHSIGSRHLFPVVNSIIVLKLFWYLANWFYFFLSNFFSFSSWHLTSIVLYFKIIAKEETVSLSMDEGCRSITKCRLEFLAIGHFLQWKQGGEKIQTCQGSEVIFELYICELPAHISGKTGAANLTFRRRFTQFDCPRSLDWLGNSRHPSSRISGEPQTDRATTW